MLPTFKLTKAEAQYCSKYYDPRNGKPGVLHRKYTGKLVLGPSQRRDAFNFQISRRSRVVAMTASGDLSQFQITISDVTGEQYLADPVPMAGLLGGYNMLPLSSLYVPPSQDNTLLGQTLSAYIFEPNIVLPPNNTLTFSALPTGPVVEDTSFRVDVTIHVVEFPGMPGSPL